MKNQNKVLISNTIAMYMLSIAKLVIPLISLPYLTRVLTVECYGSVSFVKSIISYMQILIDFGFLLSATKDVIAVIKNKGEVNKTIGNTLYAQILLCGLSAILMLICTFCFDILEGYEIYSLLSLIPAILSIFLFEYVFKAYEKMGSIAVRFVVMKVIALILTIIFVKSDADILLIPIFDIVSSLIAIVLVIFQLKKFGIKIDLGLSRIKEAWLSLKSSFVYFISNFATTAFSLLNTLLIGLALTKSDVAYWNVAIQLVCAVQALYNPIINSVFPTMVKNKDLKLIHKIMLLYMPLIFVGCGLIIVLGDWAVTLVFKEQYLMSSTLLKWLIPVMIAGFPAMLYGWPCLGAIEKQKATSISTIVSAVVQVVGLGFIALIGCFNLIALAVVRSVTEIALCLIRMTIVYKNKHKFVKPNAEDSSSLNVQQ
ncbi:MAG: hypothetical protein E7374_00785 [Clostridiales bacterium]|nr:hypothetical protein [Clostridiales bacterium]